MKRAKQGGLVSLAEIRQSCSAPKEAVPRIGNHLVLVLCLLKDSCLPYARPNLFARYARLSSSTSLSPGPLTGAFPSVLGHARLDRIMMTIPKPPIREHSTHLSKGMI